MTHRRSLFEVVAVWMASVSTAVISIGIVGLTLTFWWPYEPVTSLEIAVLGTAHPGGTLTVRVDYCKPDEAAPTDVRWTLINDVTILLEDGTASLPAGCHVTSRIFVLSAQVPPGRYRLQVEGLYQPWPWRRVEYLRRSAPFEVAP
jgi:hypothetical protein